MKSLALALLALTLVAADKPTPRQKARELLDSAAEMIAATQPDVQASALMHLADNYQAFDKEKAVEFFKQSFAASSVPPIGQSPLAKSTQMEIIVALATLDTAEGISLLKQMDSTGYDYRSFAASRVIGVLVQKNQLQPAIDLADFMGSAGAYPFAGAMQILTRIPPTDNQFAAVFSSALTAYTVKPDRTFHNLLTRYQKDLPPGMAQAAVTKILNTILGKGVDDRPYNSQTFSSSKGTATFTSREESELFDIAPLVRQIDPKRYDDILSTHAELRSALQLFPGGGPSIADDRGVTIYTVSSNSKASDSAAEKRAGDVMNNRMKMSALINTRAEAALSAAAKDPDKGLDLVADIPSPPKQAEVLARIAQSVGESNAAKARLVLARCIALLDDVKYPEDRVVAWDSVAAVAIVIKDDAILQTAVDRMLSDAAELYKDDSNAERTNRAWRENWPSTQAYRRAIIRATKLLSVDAEAVLQKITDADQNVLARIAIAQALLDRPFDRFQTYGGRQRDPQLSTGK